QGDTADEKSDDAYGYALHGFLSLFLKSGRSDRSGTASVSAPSDRDDGWFMTTSCRTGFSTRIANTANAVPNTTNSSPGDTLTKSALAPAKWAENLNSPFTPASIKLCPSRTVRYARTKQVIFIAKMAATETMYSQ